MTVTSCRPCLTLNTGILQFFADPRDRDHGRDLLPAVPDPEHRNFRLFADPRDRDYGRDLLQAAPHPEHRKLKFFADPRDRDRDLLPAVPDPEHRNSILTLKFNLQRKKNPTRILRILHQGGHVHKYLFFTYFTCLVR